MHVFIYIYVCVSHAYIIMLLLHINNAESSGEASKLFSEVLLSERS